MYWWADEYALHHNLASLLVRQSITLTFFSINKNTTKTNKRLSNLTFSWLTRKNEKLLGKPSKNIKHCEELLLFLGMLFKAVVILYTESACQMHMTYKNTTPQNTHLAEVLAKRQTHSFQTKGDLQSVKSENGGKNLKKLEVFTASHWVQTFLIITARNVIDQWMKKSRHLSYIWESYAMQSSQYYFASWSTECLSYLWLGRLHQPPS